MPDELIGFDEALKLLQINELELQEMVARGDLRAYRSGGTMKFKRADVDGLRRQRETEPTIIIPASAGSTAEPTAPTEQAAPVGELRLEMPGDEIDESAQTVGPAVVPGAEPGTEDLVFDDSELEVLPLEDDMAGTATVAAEEATMAAPGAIEDAEITVAADGEEDFEPTVAEEQPSSRRERAEAGVSGRTMISRRTSAAFAVKRGNPVMTIGLILVAAVAIFTLSVFGVILITDYVDSKNQKYMPKYLIELGVEDMKDWGKPKR